MTNFAENQRKLDGKVEESNLSAEQLQALDIARARHKGAEYAIYGFASVIPGHWNQAQKDAYQSAYDEERARKGSGYYSPENLEKLVKTGRC